MRITVTGAGGHLGAALVRRLIADGHRVRAAVHGDTRAIAGLDVDPVHVDVRDAAAIARAIDGADIVYHLAALISLDPADRDDIEDINVGGTRRVVRACLEHRVRRLVHVSSIHAFSPHPLHAPVDETRGPVHEREALHYDHSKARGEAEVRAGLPRGLDAVILNPTGLLGPPDFGPSAIGQVVRDLCLGRLPALVDGGFDWCDTRDVADAALAACTHAPSGAQYILSNRWVSMRELADLVARASGRRPPRLVSPMWLARLSAPLVAGYARLRGRPPLYTSGALHVLRCFRRVSSDKAARELGWRPRPVEESVADTVAWLRDSGDLRGAARG
jgi:dihydroflavonol-4-reductase